MWKLTILFVVISVISCTVADPNPDFVTNIFDQNPAVQLLKKMGSGQLFKVPQLPQIYMPVIPKIPLLSPEDIVKNMESSKDPNSSGISSFMSSVSTTDKDGNRINDVKGQTIIKNGDTIEKYEFGN